MRLQTHYDTLKVSRDAPCEVIAAAHKALAKKFHPDLNPKDRNAATAMQSINAARDVLLDAQKRERYDAWIRQEETLPNQYPDVFKRARKLAIDHGIEEKDLRFKKGAFRVKPTARNDSLFVMLIKFEFQRKSEKFC